MYAFVCITSVCNTSAPALIVIIVVNLVFHHPRRHRYHNSDRCFRIHAPCADAMYLCFSHFLPWFSCFSCPFGCFRCYSDSFERIVVTASVHSANGIVIAAVCFLVWWHSLIKYYRMRCVRIPNREVSWPPESLQLIPITMWGLQLPEFLCFIVVAIADSVLVVDAIVEL